MSKKEEKNIRTSKKSKENDSTNKKKKTVKIVVLVLMILLVVGIGSFIGYKQYQNSQSVGSDWGDTYYDFILNAKTNNKKIAVKDNSKIEFIEIPDIKEPVMVVNYEKEAKNYSDIYYINDSEVKNIIDLEPANVEMLYNIANKDYNWYLHITTEEEDKYTTISSTIKTSNSKKNDTEIEEYVYKIGEEIAAETVEGSKITMSKFDSEFVKVDVDVDSINYKRDLKEKDLKESMTSSIKDFKKTDEIATKKVKEEVKKKEKEIANKKEEMKKAEEEVAKKVEEERMKAEEERKRAEEEAKKGIKVGNYTLKYGTYAGEVGGPTEGLSIVLKENGQCTYEGEPCTYTIGSHDFSQDISTAGNMRPCLVIKGKYTRHLFPYNSTTIGDGDLESYEYQGN